jgi:hypothetical protein
LLDRQGRQHLLGDRDFVGLLVHAHLEERFLAVMGTERKPMGSGLIARPGPRRVLPSSASGSSARAVKVAWIQVPSTRSMADASN